MMMKNFYPGHYLKLNNIKYAMKRLAYPDKVLGNVSLYNEISE